jgi:hypothetical protein
VSATQTLGAAGGWTVSSGNGTYAETDANGWTYSGSSPYTASDATGTVSESGSDNTIVQTTVHSTWSTGNSVGVGAGWQISEGDRTMSTVSAGQWTAKGTAASSEGVGGDTPQNLDGTNTVTHSQNWSTTDTIKQTLGASANWLTTSHTDNYGSGSLDATSFNGSGAYSAYYQGGNGTATDSNSTLDSQNFNITVNYGAGGSSITSGSGTGHHGSSDTFGYSEGATWVGADSSQQYQASGGETTSSAIDTTWKYDPSGTWRPVQTHEVDTGNSTYTYQYSGSVSDPVLGGSDQATETDNGSYSYNDDLLIQTDPLGNKTYSGSDTGSGKAAGTYHENDYGSIADNSYTFTSGEPKTGHH